ncbi:MAG: hypothetical protein JWO36_3330 [Myxococcales bacterium]|nr:hypothetical protein [Myxococcales bacterium]
MNTYDLTVPQLKKTLKNLDNWLGAATAYAEKKPFPVDHLAHARLAPDQFALVRQVQSACDNAKFIAGRLTGKEWPAHPDTETTFEQLRARIASVQGFLDTFKPDDFKDSSERKITLPWTEGKWMSGADYLIQFALPNFYFHINMAYAILRHNGVELGKRDYIGGMPLHAPS